MRAQRRKVTVTEHRKGPPPRSNANTNKGPTGEKCPGKHILYWIKANFSQDAPRLGWGDGSMGEASAAQARVQIPRPTPPHTKSEDGSTCL